MSVVPGIGIGIGIGVKGCLVNVPVVGVGGTKFGGMVGRKAIGVRSLKVEVGVSGPAKGSSGG